MDGAIHSESDRQPVRTGPIELRDVGPNGRPLGTHDDIYDNGPWELHRGELVKRLMAHHIHSRVGIILGAFFENHTRDECTALADIDCVLDDAFGESVRIPDVAIVNDLKILKNEAYHGIPILAVEVRATQRKKHLEEKVKLYLEHDWPLIWLVHTERREVEVVQKGLASVTYRPGSSVPLLPELDKYGLSALPVNAFFDRAEAAKYSKMWVEEKGRERGIADGRASGLADGRVTERANALLDILVARRFDVAAKLRTRITSCPDLDTLQRWFTLAVTATSIDEFVKAMD